MGLQILRKRIVKNNEDGRLSSVWRVIIPVQ